MDFNFFALSFLLLLSHTHFPVKFTLKRPSGCVWACSPACVLILTARLTKRATACFSNRCRWSFCLPPPQDRGGVQMVIQSEDHTRPAVASSFLPAWLIRHIRFVCVWTCVQQRQDSLIHWAISQLDLCNYSANALKSWHHRQSLTFPQAHTL